MPDEATALAALDLRELAVAHGSTSALRDVSFTVPPGEVLALLGPSGAGKSTLIHAVAGFQPPATGEIWLDGRLVASPRVNVAPERRELAVVFQSYALWPHLSALDTVAYPLRRRGRSRTEARRQALRILDRLHIAHVASRLPSQLSGGEQQRVGLARALAREASLYLFDEPTAHLDTQVRTVFLEELAARLRASGAAAVYATHDAEEALGLADRVVLLDAGRVVQIGSPSHVYEQPVNLWAALLTGHASVLRAPVVSAPIISAGTGMCTITIAGAAVEIECAEPPRASGQVRHLLVRPGWARFGGDLPGRLHDVWFRGPHSDYLVQTEAGSVLIRMAGPPRYRTGESVSWSLLRAWVLSGADDVSQVAGEVSPAASLGRSDPARR